MSRDSRITHKIMASIPQKNTKPELLLRRSLWHEGMRYRVNYRKLPGKPDIVFTRPKTAVFVDGDFWHGHNWAIRGLGSLDEELNGYSEFWKNKILQNVDRDKRVNAQLQENGWLVIRLWESDIHSDIARCRDLIIQAYDSRCPRRQ